MKKYALVLIVMIVISPSWAQEINLGIKGGINVASIGGDIDGVESRLGLHVGGYAEIGFNEMFSLQPEIMYSTQGAQSARFSEVKVNLNYVTIPILAKVTFAEGFSGYLGPQIGVLVNGEIKDNEGSDNVIDDYKSADIGLVIGLGYELDNGLNFGGRFNYGLSNIDNVFNNAAEYRERNQVFRFSVGYTLNR